MSDCGGLFIAAIWTMGVVLGWFVLTFVITEVITRARKSGHNMMMTTVKK